MSDRTKTKDLLNEIKGVEDITKSLRVIVDNLPDSSVKDAFEYSTVNLEKKLEKFLAVSEPLTDEQKEAIAAIKSGKINSAKILAQISTTDTSGSPRTKGKKK